MLWEALKTKLLDIFTEKLDEQIERTNFFTRNNNIILTRLADREQENKDLKKMVKDMEEELENFHDNLSSNQELSVLASRVPSYHWYPR